MALDISIFDTITPSRYVTFTIPNPSLSHHHHLLRVAVLDSPVQLTDSPLVALMFVPKTREHDWVFCTESGHLQLLLTSPQISRLILIGDQPTDGRDSPILYHRSDRIDDVSENIQEESVRPLVTALSRKFCLKNGIYDVPICRYEDDVISSVILEKCVGDFVGEMLVEDVEIESDGSGCQKREFRRRLRFKRMPNLIQTEIKIVPQACLSSDSIRIGDQVKFRPDTGVLVHVYLVPMVASCALIGSYLSERNGLGFRPKALCVGVGGGALVSFLGSQLGFEVVGVEMDEEVLSVSRRYFGLEDGEFVRVCVGDAIEFIEKLASRANGQNSDSLGIRGMQDGCNLNNEDGLDTKFDVVMVDLDSDNIRNGVTAPPLEFVRKDVLLAARRVLSDSGILVINVIPLNRSSYEMLIHEFREIFCELYEIDAGNGENFVLIATKLPIVSSVSDCDNAFLKKLRLVISGAYMDSMRKI
ncbi:hypothetical protein ACOSP7_032984 [Xanthoceras sorbifolium]|uniref:Methyltransferase-like protein 13 n=1 Tax=Xanthoceras sorbifolium TaxID=99658 RepID=A0ABQ8H393_9ROSI|nr:hypothetical protein JRO89_XS14G0015900 [Xanthoceras sorbifolium]